MATLRTVVLLLAVVGVLGFNIDTENIVILDGPKKGIQFGFSSGMYHWNEETWAIVGAPSSNSTMYDEIPEPGGFFRCPIDFKAGQRASCTRAMPAVEPPFLGTAATYKQQNQLLGSNILIRNNTFMGCASKHKKTDREALNGFLYVLGRCNVGNLSDPDGPMRRTNFKMRQLVTSGSTFRTGMCLMGFSSAQLKNGIPTFNTVLGAPGFYDGKGGYIMIDIDNLRDRWDYLVSDDDDLGNSFTKGAYLGYSVGSGKFGNAEKGTVVAGAPHYSNSEGHVGIVVLIEIKDTSKMQTTIQGSQPGCGFGASLIVLDINGDNLDDLLVGSPFYTDQATDQGLVQVYYGTSDSRNILRQGDDLMGASSIYGRFGLAMADIGDINADGFNDVAIGAPYEDDQSGAIYIYNGNRQNMNSDFSQRIAAQALNQELKGFGFHISSPLDADFNTYNDISVGAYLSDQAIILRTRPIVQLDRYVTLNPELVPLNPAGQTCHKQGDPFPCLTYSICFNFTGRGLDRINIDIGLSVDLPRKRKGKSSRMDLYLEDERRGDSFIIKYQIQKSTNSCKTILARVNSLGREFFAAIEQPVEFYLNYSLSREPVLGEVMPILDNLKDPTISRSANFNTGCGRQRCISNLQIEVTVDKAEVIMGLTEDISLTININNLEEPAFVTRVLTKSSENALFRGDEIEAGQIVCKQNATGMIDEVACDFTTPFFQTMIGTFDLKYTFEMLDDDDLNNIDPMVSFNMNVTSESEEMNPSDNDQLIEIPVKIKPDISIYGSSNPEQATISPDSNKLLYMEKTFNIYNRGPSPLPETRITIEFPRRNLQGDILVEAQNTKVSLSSSNVKCRILSSSEDLNQQTTTTSSVSPEKIVSSDNVLQRLIQNMTCNRYDCVHMECSLKRLNVESSVTITLAINITESSLTFEKNAERLNYVTTAEIHKPQHPSVTVAWPKSPVKAEIRADIYPAEEIKVTEEFEIWILIVGCLGGLLLFVALGLILWKCGFFRRKKREEVQAWKRKSGYNARRTQRASSMNRNTSSSVKSHSKDPRATSFLE
ncbi:integrin alpha-9-like isoform X2 [Ylistrum balloti]|uniref:integrin alpha-9-like isoform X2 n=1 Tax=Ylistrum balloti TaxID=509963 RepID=UPI002905D60F|nr:integrin alpha-9-like isoform X2 [Ylistrum balloti]